MTIPSEQERSSGLGIASVILALLSPLLFLVCFLGAMSALFSSTSGDVIRHVWSGTVSFTTFLYWLGLSLSPIMLLLAWILGIAGLMQQGCNKGAAVAGIFISTFELMVCVPIISTIIG